MHNYTTFSTGNNRGLDFLNNSSNNIKKRRLMSFDDLHNNSTSTKKDKLNLKKRLKRSFSNGENNDGDIDFKKKLFIYIDTYKLDIIESTRLYMDYQKMYEKIIRNFIQSPDNQFNHISLIKIKVTSDSHISLFIPVQIKLADIFSPQVFAENWKNAFDGTDIFSHVFEHLKYKNVQATIKFPDISSTSVSTKGICDEYELGYFRMIVCISFAFLFKLRSPLCACFPQTPTELIAVQKLGLYMNCINNVSCNSLLSQRPEFYDARFMGDCDNTKINDIQNMLFNLDLKITGNKNIIDISAKQQ
jgi:hypothetical protein